MRDLSAELKSRARGAALIAATPQRLRRAFHSGAALPGLYSGRFLFGAVRHDPPKKRKPAVRAAGLLTEAIERE